MYQPAIVPERAHGVTAPSPRVRSLFGMTRSGSISSLNPMPVHSEQAPCGLLNENVRGAISPSETPQSMQANCSLKSSSSPVSASSVWMTPAPRRSEVSTESVTRPRISPRSSGMTSLSTTTSMVCHFCLLSGMSSERSRISPLTRARTNPPRRASSSRPECSPFFAAHQRRQEHPARPRRRPKDRIHNLLHGLAFNGTAAVVAEGMADARIQQPQIVINLRHRADRRAGVVRDALLID